ncbi:MAG: glycosyltransferase family A protein [Nanoarchaeota archaeon]
MVEGLVSVIIPMYNEEKDIVSCLSSLKKQSHKNIEIILVDDGSTDRTVEVAKQQAIKDKIKITILNQKHGGPGKARNLGASKANGEILVFVDSDMTFDKDYIKNLIKPINRKVIGTTHDFEIVRNTKNIWSKCWGRVRVSPKNAYEVKIFRAINRKKFLELGGFDPKYGYADDQTFWFKNEIRPNVASNTKCYHKNPERLKQVYSQSRWIGASTKTPLENTSLRKIEPFMMILISPILIVFFSIKKCFTIKKISIFPVMLIFMTARYLGTIAGLFRARYIQINYR